MGIFEKEKWNWGWFELKYSKGKMRDRENPEWTGSIPSTG